MQLPMCQLVIVTYLLSCAVASEIWQIVGVDLGMPIFNTAIPLN